MQLVPSFSPVPVPGASAPGVSSPAALRLMVPPFPQGICPPPSKAPADSTPRPVVGRFAPSPTGRMHLGNIFSALLSWLSAKSQGGRWLLRMEDIDPQRSRQDYADLIMDDLLWLGLCWDEGPAPHAAPDLYYQSQRSAIYEEHLQRLQRLGLVYPCYCTRADILATQAPHESDGRVVYKGTCRPEPLSLNSPECSGLLVPQPEPAPFSLNSPQCSGQVVPQPESAPFSLNNPQCSGQVVPQPEITFRDAHYGTQSVSLADQVGDFIVRRKDGAWAYQLAVVVDDALMGVTEVVRGRDLLLSSPQQIYLARLLGYTPPRFTHLPLLCNTAGQRLSKRDKSLDMSQLRQRYTAPQLIGILAHLAGLQPSPAPITPHALLPLFSWDKIPLADITVHTLP